MKTADRLQQLIAEESEISSLIDAMREFAPDAASPAARAHLADALRSLYAARASVVADLKKAEVAA